jgi:hypothetical protein
MQSFYRADVCLLVGVCVCVRINKKEQVNIMQELLVVPDLMTRWRCGRRSVENRTRRYAKPRLKFIRLSSKLLFRPEDVIEYEKSFLLNPMKSERPAL